MAEGYIIEGNQFEIAKRQWAIDNGLTNEKAVEMFLSMKGNELSTGFESNEHAVVLPKKSNGGLYYITYDFKLINEYEALALSVRSGGASPSDFCIRHCFLDKDYNVLYEKELNTPADLEAFANYGKLVIDYNDIVNDYPVFYFFSALPTSPNSIKMWRCERNTSNQWVFTSALWDSGFVNQSQYTNVTIDTSLRPNGKPFFWVCNRGAQFSSEQGRVVGLYDNGTSWVGTSMSFAPHISGVGTVNNGCGNTPIDTVVYNGDLYVMFHDTGVSPTVPPNYLTSGKISLWKQTSGSATNPSDRVNFLNYTFQYSLYININGSKNVNGVAPNNDLFFAGGMQMAGLDVNGNPIIVATHDPNGDGTTGARHYSRIRANIANPTDGAHWTIETPMAASNGSYWTSSDPYTSSGSSDGTTETNKMPRKETDQITFINPNLFISGSTSGGYYTIHTINSWDGTSLNTWRTIAPNDTTFTGTLGNRLALLW